jgi:hypothetical protein
LSFIVICLLKQKLSDEYDQSTFSTCIKMSQWSPFIQLVALIHRNCVLTCLLLSTLHWKHYGQNHQKHCNWKIHWPAFTFHLIWFFCWIRKYCSIHPQTCSFSNHKRGIQRFPTQRNEMEMLIAPFSFAHWTHIILLCSP